LPAHFRRGQYTACIQPRQMATKLNLQDVNDQLYTGKSRVPHTCITVEFFPHKTTYPPPRYYCLLGTSHQVGQYDTSQRRGEKNTAFFLPQEPGKVQNDFSQVISFPSLSSFSPYMTEATRPGPGLRKKPANSLDHFAQSASVQNLLLIYSTSFHYSITIWDKL